jgi:hypothetical protein
MSFYAITIVQSSFGLLYETPTLRTQVVLRS